MSDEKKDKVLRVRVGDVDFEALHTLAQKMDVTVSEVLRRAARLYVDTA